jgi:hypothetical protein
MSDLLSRLQEDARDEASGAAPRRALTRIFRRLPNVALQPTGAEWSRWVVRLAERSHV